MIDFAPLFGPQTAAGQTATFRVFPRSGTERWLLEAHYRRPWHLETWPQANLRARMIYRAAWLLALVGLHLPSRRLTLTIADSSLYSQLYARFGALGVFLGTPGPNRKFVVFAKNTSDAWFIKVPLNMETAALARNEAAILSKLATDLDLAQMVPRCFWIGEALAIEDVRTAGASFAPLDIREVIRVHDLLFARSSTEVPLAELAQRWKGYCAAGKPHDDPDTRRAIDSARKAACEYLDALSRDMRVACYEAHGDFTRWNVLRAVDGSARIIDWELVGMRPKFFDPLHYLVSQAILVQRAPAHMILDRVIRIGSRLANRSEILQYFGLYLAEQTLVHCDLYERSDEMFAQVRWHLRTWTELFNLLSPDHAPANAIQQPRPNGSEGATP